MKEKVIISYGKGITHSPSDILCNDGDLEECVNLEVRDGELVPMEMPVKLPFSLSEGERLILIHNTKTKEKNYITISDGVLKAFYQVGTNREYFDFQLQCGNIKSIQSIGNTIVLYTEESPYYILYTNGKYKNIGNKIPEVGISFDLNGEFVVSEEFEINTPEGSLADEDFQREVCGEIVPEVNKFIEEKATSVGKFMYPFFVRYALRLFDGTHTMHSAPILLLPSTNISPFVSSYADARNFSNKTFKAQTGAFVAQMEATVSFISGSLSDWSDVVTAIDIFVSRQIVTYDQNGTKFGDASASGSKFVGKYNGNPATVWDGYSVMSEKVTLEQPEGTFLHRWYIPSNDTEKITDDIANTSLFYKYATLGLGDMQVGSTMELSGTLSSLEVGEVLMDDYMTHDTFIPESSFVYNSRLNISNVTRKLFGGFPVQCMAQTVKSTPKDGFDYGLVSGTYEVYTFIRGSEVVVKSGLSDPGSLYAPFLFYPDSDAYKMIIMDRTNSRHAEITLSEHPLLNGAYYFNGFNALQFTPGVPDVVTTKNEEVMMNKLLVSNVNNPFHFPLEGIYTVGSDRIIGMGAVTRPISQGQFGEFPLIVFCSDGNYAMRVDEQGFYAAISPVQEDVVLGDEKITPMENSILVVTKKGVMLTTGGEMSKIAGLMEGGVSDCSGFSSISTSVDALSTLVSKSKDTEGFLSYVYGARMAFDYASNRVLIYNPKKSYAYFYRFDNDTTTKMVVGGGASIISSVIDYPDTIIQDSNGTLYSLYNKEDLSVKDERMYGFALTRPLKMNAVMNMKAISQIMNVATYGGNGSFVKYNLYGSNDNVKYYKVSSRFGRPYKYYRVAIYTSLLPKESLSGTAFTIEERRTHKLR